MKNRKVTKSLEELQAIAESGYGMSSRKSAKSWMKSVFPERCEFIIVRKPKRSCSYTYAPIVTDLGDYKKRDFKEVSIAVDLSIKTI